MGTMKLLTWMFHSSLFTPSCNREMRLRGGLAQLLNPPGASRMPCLR